MKLNILSYIAAILGALLLSAVPASLQAAQPGQSKPGKQSVSKPLVLAQGAPAQQLTPAQKKKRAEQLRRKRQLQNKRRQQGQGKKRPAGKRARPAGKSNKTRAQKLQRQRQRALQQKRRKLNQQKALQRKKQNRLKALQRQRKAKPSNNRALNERKARGLDKKQRELNRKRKQANPVQTGPLNVQKYRPSGGESPAARKARIERLNKRNRANAIKNQQRKRAISINKQNQRRAVAVKRRRKIQQKKVVANRKAYNRLRQRRATLNKQINQGRNRKARLNRQNARLARQRNWRRSNRNNVRRRAYRNFAFRERARVVEKRRNRTILTALAGAAVGAAIVGSYYVYHNDDNRLHWRSREVYADDLNNGWTRSVIVRPNGVRVVTIRDTGGFIVRRYRVYPGNRVAVLYDNQPRWWNEDALAVDVAPVRYSGPRDRYIVEPSSASVDTIYDTVVADPVADIDRTYTLNQILVNRNLRGYMPRIDVDSIAFASGSSTIPESQLDKLDSIGAAMEAAIKENPNEVYLIEGHTDSTGSDVDNLALSDERASSIANALTEYYDIPPENLVTQGYGEEFLKVDRSGPDSRNRRVAIRRITPLLATESDDIALDDDGNEIFDEG